jgi:glycosyltransferase involved in cell wall biosynthesis
VAWGHEVRVITRPIAQRPHCEVIDGIEIRRTIQTLSLGPLWGITFIGSVMASLVRLVTGWDVVLAAQAPWEAVATGAVHRLTGKPTAVRVANAGPFGDLRQLQLATGRGLLVRLVKSNCLFIALSDQSQEELLQLGCAADRIRRLTNGVDTDHFTVPAEQDTVRDRTVLFVGRLCAQKNPLSLLGAWRQVNAAAQYRLLIAGAGDLEAPVRQFIADQGLSNVELLGTVRDLRDVYHRAAVFVLPSLSEGCSNSLLEAMASGLCPVATDIGGNRELLTDAVNGRLVAAENDQQLADALSQVLGDAVLRTRLARAARDHVVAHHQLDDVARRYLDLFAEMVG